MPGDWVRNLTRDGFLSYFRKPWFLGILFLLVALRAVFLVAYPFGFAHPDGPPYTDSVRDVLLGNPYVPNALRVNGTYALFLLPVLRLIGSGIFSIAFAQHLLGVLTALIVFAIVREHTKSDRWAGFALLVSGLLPRGYFYEHIVLVDTLYAFLFILFAWAGLRWLSHRQWRWAMASGSLAGLLVLSRGQGLVAVPLGVLMAFAAAWNLRLGRRRLALSLVAYLVPVALICGTYVGINIARNGFYGLSAHGNLHLFWVATVNLLDFDSPLHSETKQVVRNCVEKSNRSYTGDATWPTRDDSCWKAQGDLHALLTDWKQIDHVTKALNREAIIGHPVAFSYRILWNLRDFLLAKTHFFKTVDIASLFLDGTPRRFRLVPERIASLEKYDSFAAMDRTGLEKLRDPLSQSRASTIAQAAFERVLNWLHPLVDVRFFTASFLLFISLAVWSALGARALPATWLALSAFSQILITVLPGNAWFDRYYVPIEPLQIALFCLCAQSGLELARPMRWRVIATFFATPVLAFASWKTFSLLPFPYPFRLDKPILGMPASGLEIQQRYLLSFVFASICLGMALLWVRTKVRLGKPEVRHG